MHRIEFGEELIHSFKRNDFNQSDDKLARGASTNCKTATTAKRGATTHESESKQASRDQINSAMIFTDPAVKFQTQHLPGFVCLGVGGGLQFVNNPCGEFTVGCSRCWLNWWKPNKINETFISKTVICLLTFFKCFWICCLLDIFGADWLGVSTEARG